MNEYFTECKHPTVHADSIKSWSEHIHKEDAHHTVRRGEFSHLKAIEVEINGKLDVQGLNICNISVAESVRAVLTPLVLP